MAPPKLPDDFELITAMQRAKERAEELVLHQNEVAGRETGFRKPTSLQDADGSPSGRSGRAGRQAQQLINQIYLIVYGNSLAEIDTQIAHYEDPLRGNRLCSIQRWIAGFGKKTPAAASPAGAKLAKLTAAAKSGKARRGRRALLNDVMLRRAMELREPIDGTEAVAWTKVAETIEVEFRGELNGQAVADSTLRQAYQRWRGMERLRSLRNEW